MQEVIYLDNCATTQIDNRVLEAMMPYLTHNFANANSTHQFGVGANEAVKIARNQVAELIGAEPNEIIFTSGATEAINLAIKGVARNYKSKGNHIITVSTEHSAVLDTCKYLENEGYEITYLSVQADGLIDLFELKQNLRKDTILVSVMMVNNETGVIQPIKEIASLVHEYGAYFLTDATQAVGKLSINVDDAEIDLLCLSGHKFYGPKGVGALFIRQRIRRLKIPALLHGGGHEKGFRSGTLNVPAIVGIGHASLLARKEMKQNAENILLLRNHLEFELLKIEDTFINGHFEKRLYNVTNICFVGADSDAMILGLSNTDTNLPLIAISNGSACTSTSIEPSHVLISMALTQEYAFSSIRFSLGKYNSKSEIDTVISSVKNVVTELRAMAN